MPVDLSSGEGLDALDRGIWTKAPDISPFCPSGNCTWPVSRSMGVCARCEDVTTSAGLTGCDGVPFNISSFDALPPVPCTINLPGPLSPLNMSLNPDR